ncbi:tetratricopeptide repeat protein [Flagellimonas meishanensis]|uniref:tetratricopeptide repeat protein n=1 Tax=Flagellimonas meishanensis TaxID=2873264 RepID=UPI001CA61BB6|nr:tetratricopeptide repeat protein [[Muricauda] meishanensis]
MGYRFSLPIFLLLSFVSIERSLGQTKEIDSLQNLLKTATDTTEVNILRFLGQRLRSHDREKALDYLSRSLEKSEETGFVYGQINGLYSLGLTHGMTGGYEESLDYLNRCLKLAIEHGDFETRNSVYNAMGIVYKRIGDYPKSQSYYLKRIQLIDSLQLDQDVSAPYLNLGVLYDLMDDQQRAIESYNKALEMYRGDDRESFENNILDNLAEIDFKNDEYEVALNKFLQTSAYYQKTDQNIILCTIYSRIGDCYLKLKQWSLANEYLQKSLELAQQLSIKQEIADAYNNLADLKLQQRIYDEATVYSNKNLEGLESMGAYDQKVRAHETAYKIYEATNQFPKSIYHLNQMMAYKDSLLNETKIKEIQNLQVQHNVYLKDKEIRENELQLALLNTTLSLNNKRIVYLVIITLLLFFSAGLLYFRYRSKKRSNETLRKKNELISAQKEVIEEMNVELEKRMLRAQMNPHFVFNSLNSIQHLINSDDRVNALKYLSKFSKLLRQVLESSINVNLSLREELDLLQIYLDLESLRFDNSFNYKITVDEKLDVNEHQVPMLLIQPYVENAIIHGLMPKKGPKKLSISFNDKDRFIECIIEDNGVGVDSKSNQNRSEGPSRGMSITAKRIAGLEKFSNEELLKIESLNSGDNTGTRVTILVPKEEHHVENLAAKNVIEME